ncbi:glycosyltransferase [Mucilaginibacter sp. SMC90]|uniref:glycosyltransferase family 2 protein n=1 Tax=Mucilaginibacter sp. SMC90 TaxID=2929803 RepID=UPI001FB56B18|nr:glycosyltransferase family 2 protein [Mucilaginibacter sp. SMC90]UOE48195.1 glycosyltransferase [Mucilaginibacter sp. SMC90]
MISILIPTYNRSEFLLKNLIALSVIIKQAGLVDNIEIIVSDNCSIDDTSEVVTNFAKDHQLKIKLFKQERNIGLEANALFVLEKGTEQYVMFLGDDDYISYDYLVECVRIIKADPDLYVIIPNFVPVSVNDEELGLPRDLIGGTTKYPPGFKALLINSYRGHQLSGLVLRREGLLDSYQRNKVHNIYLFIYFASAWCLKGNVYHVSHLPVRVTQPIKKKDWSYGGDGLINEVFDNYKRLHLNYFQRFAMEIKFMHRSPTRLSMYKAHGVKVWWKALRNITFAKNATVLFSVFFPLYVALNRARNVFK